METRRLITALVASMIVFIAWMFVGPMIMPPPAPAKQATTRPAEDLKTAQADTQPSEEPSRWERAATRTEEPSTKETRVASAPTQPEPKAKPVGDASAARRGELSVTDEFPRSVTIGSDDPNQAEFKLKVRINSSGASVESADLAPAKRRYRNFPPGDERGALDEEEDPFDSYDLLRPLKDDQTGRVYRGMATEQINVLRGRPTDANQEEEPAEDEEQDWRELVLADKHWALQRKHEDDRDVVVCKIDVRADDQPLLRLVKTYTLFHASFELHVDLHVETLDGRPHQVILTQRGPLNIHGQQMRGDSRKVYYALKVGDMIESGSVTRKETVVEKRVDDGPPKLEHNPVRIPGPDKEAKLLWAALGNQYFTVIMTPVDVDREANSGPISDTQVKHLTNNTGSDENADLTYHFVTNTREVGPKDPLQIRFDVFMGPKERDLFQNGKEHPTYVERNYMATIQEEYYFCVWAPLAELMSNLLIGLHHYVWPHNWGLAIIILVLVVRVILHPITKKGQVSMTRMQAKMAELQPKLDELKKKYGNDRNKLNQETMALYREEGINPASNMMSCLPMLLQMPIWVALWATLSNTIELRHAPFMIIPGHWILDLASPDAIYRFAKPIRLLFFEIDAINVLPFLWGLSMVLQQKLMPKPKSGKTTEQMQQQQRMMYMMAVMFTVMFYSFPSGLTLYIMASNFFGLIEQWRIRKHIEAEDHEPAKPVPEGASGKPEAKKGKGLAGSLLEKVEKFDQQQRGLRSSKKKK